MTETLKPLADDFPAADAAKWRALVDKILKGETFDKRLVGRTADGLKIQPVYRRADAAGAGAGGALVPRRGMAPHFGWDIRQVQSGRDAGTVNAAVLEDLAGGATSVTLVTDAAARGGLAADAATLGRALKDVLLDVCPVALDAGGDGVAAAQALMQVWTDAGLAADKRMGAFNFDPAGALARDGRLPGSVDASLATAGQLVAQVQSMPGVTALMANGATWHNAGASEAQELGAVLATVVAYLRAAEAAGVAPGAALGKIVIGLAVDADQLMGLAKLRAARVLLARVAEACGAGAAAARVQIAAETSQRMMSKRDPWVNMLRTTMACAVGAMGGADSITVYPFTWALGQPDAFARRMARNTSLVLQEESGLGRVADPAAGSFAVEALTHDLAQAAWGEFQAVEKAGGIVAALVSGMVQDRIGAVAVARQRSIATGRTAVTGTSAFPRLGSDGVTVQPWPAHGPRTGVSDTTVRALVPVRDGGAFEALRDAVDAQTATSGVAPKVFLACLGPLAVHGARATWIKNFLAAGGIDSVTSGEILASQDVGRLYAESGVPLACICSSDAVYGELGDASVMALKSAGAAAVFVAGRPKDFEAALTAAGADGFLSAGQDMVATLTALVGRYGVKV